MVKHLAFNQGIESSSLSGHTIYFCRSEAESNWLLTSRLKIHRRFESYQEYKTIRRIVAIAADS